MNEIDSILDSHYKWLSSDGIKGKRANLSGMDLRMADLDGVDLSYAILKGTNLERANLSNAILDNADMRSSNLGYASLVSASLKKTKLDSSSFVGADLTNALLDNAIISQACLNDAICINASFGEVKAVKTLFERCDLSKASFDNAYIDGANFLDSNMSNASLIRAEVYGCSFLGANIADVIVSSVVFEENIYDSSQDIFCEIECDVKLTPQQFNRAHKLIGKGYKIGKVSDIIGVSRSLVKKNINELEAPLEYAAIFQKNKIKQKIASALLFRRLGFVLISASVFSFIILGAISLISFLSDMFFDEAYQFSNSMFVAWMFISMATLGFSLFCFVKSYRIQDETTMESQEKSFDS